MPRKRILTVAIAITVIAIFHLAPRLLSAQTGDAVALTGVMNSQEDGRLEGVVVSVRREGANFTVSVVSDADGRYTFPRSHVEPGTYDLTIRAVGFNLRAPVSVEVTADESATSNQRLRKTADLASQLSSLEWAMSMPGTTADKDQLVYQALSCAYCHTYERIVKSRHTAEEFVPVIQRMSRYYQDGTAQGRGGRGRAAMQSDEALERLEQNPPQSVGIAPGVPGTDLGQYLATVNLSGGKATWPYELQTLPRPTGEATRVIITQWDMPRRGTVPHDMDVDSQGVFWYTD